MRSSELLWRLGQWQKVYASVSALVWAGARAVACIAAGASAGTKISVKATSLQSLDSMEVSPTAFAFNGLGPFRCQTILTAAMQDDFYAAVSPCSRLSKSLT